MFAGPKMPQGADGFMGSNLQTGTAPGDFNSILQALLSDSLGLQDENVCNASCVFSDMFQAITDKFNNRVVTSDELAGFIQGLLVQLPAMQDDFASKLGMLLSETMNADKSGKAPDMIKTAVEKILQTNPGLSNLLPQTSETDAPSAENLKRAADSTLLSNGLSDILDKLNKAESNKSEVLLKDAPASFKKLSTEEFFKQLAGKITDQKTNSPAGVFEDSESGTFKFVADDDIFNRLATEAAKSADKKVDSASADGLKNASDMKLSGTASTNGPNAHNEVGAAKEPSYVSKIHDIDQVILKMANSGQQRLVIRIDPPELGNIQIKLVMQNGIIRADFRVDNQAVKDSFAFALPQIKTSLEDAGIKTGEFFVDLKEDYYSDRKEGQDRQQHNKHQNEQSDDSSFFELFA
jgi:flagellar hook-length control protein FliK